MRTMGVVINNSNSDNDDSDVNTVGKVTVLIILVIVVRVKNSSHVLSYSYKRFCVEFYINTMYESPFASRFAKSADIRKRRQDWRLG